MSNNINLCKNEENLKINIPQKLDYLRVNIYRTNVFAEVFSEPNYKGKKWIINLPGMVYEYNQIPFFNIQSVKYYSDSK